MREGWGGLGIYREAPPPCLPLTGKCVAVGAFRAQTSGVLFLRLLAQAPQSRGEAARAVRAGALGAGAASHDGAAVPAQRALEAQGGVHVLAAGAADALEQLAEEQQDMPVVLGRALHVTALPGLAHQV